MAINERCNECPKITNLKTKMLLGRPDVVQRAQAELDSLICLGPIDTGQRVAVGKPPYEAIVYTCGAIIND